LCNSIFNVRTNKKVLARIWRLWRFLFSILEKHFFALFLKLFLGLDNFQIFEQNRPKTNLFQAQGSPFFSVLEAET